MSSSRAIAALWSSFRGATATGVERLEWPSRWSIGHGPGGAAGGLALCWPERVSAPGVDCWPGLVPNTFIVGGAFVAGGRAMDWWADIATEGDLLQALALAETAPAGANGLVCLPFLAGERSPLWDPAARGAIIKTVNRMVLMVLEDHGGRALGQKSASDLLDFSKQTTTNLPKRPRQSRLEDLK